MSDRLFNVFLSSTQKDLRSERRSVANRLLDRRVFLPVLMERFPAVSQRALHFVYEQIRRSDYYVLIIGHEYGSLDGDVSFTEREYDYAVGQGLPVLAFLREIPRELESSCDPKLLNFRARVEADRGCKYWREVSELCAQVVEGLSAAVDSSPRVGWIRGDELPDDLQQTMRLLVRPAERLGITEISQEGSAGAEMGRAIASAHEVSIMATSGLRLVETQKRALVRCLDNGGTVRMLTAEQGGTFLDDVEEMEGRSPELDSISNEIGRVRVRLGEIRQEATAEKGLLLFGSFRTQLRSTLVLCDDEWGWLSLTLPPMRTPETASFELRHGTKGSLLWASRRHFDQVWDVAERHGRVTAIGLARV